MKHSHVESSNFLVLTVVSMVFIVMVLGVSGALYCLRHHSHLKLKEKLASLGTDTSADATAAYQVRGLFMSINCSPPIALHMNSLQDVPLVPTHHLIVRL